MFQICVGPCVFAFEEADNFFTGGGFFCACDFEEFFGFFDGCGAGFDELFWWDGQILIWRSLGIDVYIPCSIISFRKAAMPE